LPDSTRLADDPYGAAFSSPSLQRALERSRGRLRPLTAFPGLREWILYMQVRTRVIDDALRAFVASGGRQLVVLGAGYDCRALRMPELHATRVFEVDHPATQRHKRDVLARIDTTSPSRYVTWHFEERPMRELPGALAEAGHDHEAPTFTIWEGVTMYLTEPAIDASLRAIVAWSAPQSQLAMTYFARNVLSEPSLATRAVQAIVSRVGEPWRFGWAPAELPGYLAARGLELLRDISLADAAHQLLPADPRDSTSPPRIAASRSPVLRSRRRSPSRRSADVHVLVVGSGIFGITAALELRARGCAVTIVDAGSIPAADAESTDISKVVRIDYGSDEDYTRARRTLPRRLAALERVVADGAVPRDRRRLPHALADATRRLRT